VNIFYFHQSPVVSAHIQHDRHIVKMILESCQMLSAAIQSEDDVSRYILRPTYDSIAKSYPDPSLYKLTHVNHPSSVWARSGTGEFVWLTIHAHELLAEYRRRFNRAHKCSRLIYLFGAMASRLNEGSGFVTKDWSQFTTEDGVFRTQIVGCLLDLASRHSTPPFCGPSQFDNGNVIESYRDYYITEKLPGNRWTRHDSLTLPKWLMEAGATIVDPKTPSGPTRKRVFASPKPPKELAARFPLKLKLTNS
jgi:hypothetical protein